MYCVIGIDLRTKRPISRTAARYGSAEEAIAAADRLQAESSALLSTPVLFAVEGV